ncbi:hypothetical protein [Burkholderia sp. 3C]
MKNEKKLQRVRRSRRYVATSAAAQTAIGFDSALVAAGVVIETMSEGMGQGVLLEVMQVARLEFTEYLEKALLIHRKTEQQLLFVSTMGLVLE